LTLAGNEWGSRDRVAFDHNKIVADVQTARWHKIYDAALPLKSAIAENEQYDRAAISLRFSLRLV
jgi:hypothetical protein